ncbi:MAG: choice-of-anchor D domain-containing protein, partial [Terriglobia bacterium]
MPSQIHFENHQGSRCAMRRAKLSIFSFFVILFFCVVKGTTAAPVFVQEAANTTSGTTISFSLSFPKNTVAGDLIVVGFDFATTTTASSVTDSQGNPFTQVGTQLTSPGGSRSVVYYAKKIKGGADTVTVNLSANSPYIELYLTEYSGVNQTNPIDAQAGASGNAGPVSSGNATTTVAGDMIYGYCMGDWACTAGSGFAARSTFDDNLIDDRTVTNPGTYAATGTASSGWTMQLVALKPASAVASLSPSSLTFASQAVGVTSAAQTLTLNNTGNATLTLTSLALAGANANDFAQTNTCGASVAAGAKCTVSVTFTPAASGALTAAVTLTDNASGSPQNVSLAGTGTATTAVASLSPGSLTFASQPIGATSAPQAITVNNTGNAALSITSLALTGANASDFAQTNTCGSSVAVGASCTISVTFKPTTSGSRTAAVTLTDNATGSPQTISLTGTGTAAIASFSPGSLTFASEAVGATSAAETVTLNNTGNAALTLTSLALTGASAGNFAQTNTCGASVAAGANCTVSVTFTPAASG